MISCCEHNSCLILFIKIIISFVIKLNVYKILLQKAYYKNIYRVNQVFFFLNAIFFIIDIHISLHHDSLLKP